MAQRTNNLGLTKPEASDKISPTIFADNFDIIDEAVANKMSTTGGTFKGNVRIAEGSTILCNANSAETTFRGILVRDKSGVAQSTRNLIMDRK